MEDWKVLRQGIYLAGIKIQSNASHWEQLKAVIDPEDMPKNLKEMRKLHTELPIISNRLRKRIENGLLDEL